MGGCCFRPQSPCGSAEERSNLLNDDAKAAAGPAGHLAATSACGPQADHDIRKMTDTMPLKADDDMQAKLLPAFDASEPMLARENGSSPTAATRASNQAAALEDGAVTRESLWPLVDTCEEAGGQWEGGDRRPASPVQNGGPQADVGSKVANGGVTDVCWNADDAPATCQPDCLANDDLEDGKCWASTCGQDQNGHDAGAEVAQAKTAAEETRPAHSLTAAPQVAGRMEKQWENLDRHAGVNSKGPGRPSATEEEEQRMEEVQTVQEEKKMEEAQSIEQTVEEEQKMEEEQRKEEVQTVQEEKKMEEAQSIEQTVEEEQKMEEVEAEELTEESPQVLGEEVGAAESSLRSSEEDLYRGEAESAGDTQAAPSESNAPQARCSLGPPVDMLAYGQREWRGNTAKSALIRKGYQELSRRFAGVRQVRGDNYCALRATLFQVLSQASQVPPWLQDDDDTLWQDVWELTAEWRFAGEAQAQPDVARRLQSYLQILRNKWAAAARCPSAAERRQLCDGVFRGGEEELAMLEALKLLMLRRAVRLHAGVRDGEDDVPLFCWLLFARDSSRCPRTFLANHLSRVGLSAGMEQVEMCLLGDALRCTLQVFRLYMADSEDFVAYYPDEHKDRWPRVSLVTEDDRHYNVPVAS